MATTPLTALSPLDGRYHNKVDALAGLFSELGLMRRRVLVEVEWLKALSREKMIAEVPEFSPKTILQLDALVANFTEADGERVKAIEAETNHDVKAIEYFLRERLKDNAEVMKVAEFIHFACTSEDVNNLAHAMMLKRARDEVLLPTLDRILEKLAAFSHELAELPMLARTHGQPASPTTLGKEMANFAYRLQRAHGRFAAVELLGKINGAVGNYNAHVAAYPDFDWEAFAKRFVERLGLVFNPYTTQIEPHDALAELFDACVRVNTILTDLDRDLWSYISLGYFKQRLNAGEVGSSTMPHKVNPIEFENAEGNLGVATALLEFLARKLPRSRWQRDLTDSTVLRNLAVALGHSFIAVGSCRRGLAKLDADRRLIAQELDESWEVLAEAVQTVMRRHGIADAYERLKALTRGQRIGADELRAFIESADLPDDARQRLLALKPSDYTGLARDLATKV